jgi:hypothetical protein
MQRVAALVAPVAAAIAASACVPARAPAPPTTQAAWDAALAQLARLRAELPAKPYTQPVTVDFFEPRSRRHFDGRGAVGVYPGHAMRMILIGPAGETALDVWVTPDAWRLDVPPIHLVRRGGRETPKGTPVGFFRSWFVEPLAGRLLAIGRGGELVVRDPFGGTLHVDAESLAAGTIRRRSGSSTESFVFGASHARYVDEGTGLAVDVTMGPVQADPPDPEAFVDPDARGRGQ